ncbi:MAG: McrC family protein [Oscillospiraceae bacterium]|jgi:5-methylcytosine-specific restriction enzyme subunit McrC|nr:McrC family protein [Oscillospiraceae bacterium]
MATSNKHYTITEYEGFINKDKLSSGYGQLPKGYTGIPGKIFDALETSILTYRQSKETEAVELLSLSASRGIGKTITARNYVGVITMKDGTVIEILPKIHGDISGNTYEERTKATRDIFLKMLRTLRDSPFKEFRTANLKTEKMNILEVFISMFLSEVSSLVKQGIKSDYNTIEENERFFKGKLNVSQNIKHNHSNKSRFYVKYEVFNIDRPENRLIKSTLLFLKNKSTDSHNKMSITRLLSFFESIDISNNYDTDFSMCKNNRSMSHYAQALVWCYVFLRGSSFTAFSGKDIAIALLFPMEKIFESYVSVKLRRMYADTLIYTQDNTYSLFDSPTRKFNLRPDIVMKHQEKPVILDTKWKILSANSSNYGISQSDMYQMYAYSKKYDAQRVILIYPLSESLREKDIESYYANEISDTVQVDVSFVDLSQPDEISFADIRRKIG